MDAKMNAKLNRANEMLEDASRVIKVLTAERDAARAQVGQVLAWAERNRATLDAEPQSEHDAGYEGAIEDVLESMAKAKPAVSDHAWREVSGKTQQCALCGTEREAIGRWGVVFKTPTSKRSTKTEPRCTDWRDTSWTQAVEAVRHDSPRHGKSLSHARLVSIEPGVVRVAFPADTAFHRAAVFGESRHLIEASLGLYFGRPTRLEDGTT